MIIACAIVTKILFVLYILAILNSLRHLYIIIRMVMSEEENKYKISPKTLLLLGISIAFIITGIINGIGIC